MKYISDSINSTNSDQEEPPEEKGNKVWSRQQAAEILLGAQFIKAKFSKELDEQLGLVNELVSKQMAQRTVKCTCCGKTIVYRGVVIPKCTNCSGKVPSKIIKIQLKHKLKLKLKLAKRKSLQRKLVPMIQIAWQRQKNSAQKTNCGDPMYITMLW